MSLPARSVRRPIGTVVVYFAVVVLGLVALGRIPVDLMPSVDMPRINVTTTYDGVAPQEIETLITRPVEQAVSTISGIEEIDATSAEGLSRVQLQFAWGTDLDTAVNDVRAQLDRLRARLPEDAEPPLIYKFDLSSFPVATLGVSGRGDPRRIRYLADEQLSRRLERLPGVASVGVLGGRVREIQVRLSTERLVALGVTAGEVASVLQRENRNVSAGDLLDRGREVVVRTVGEFDDVSQIADTVVTTRNGRPIRVSDLGEVDDAFQDVKSEMWINGEPGIRMRVSKQDGANTVQVVDDVRRELARINADYAGQVELTMLSDSSVFVQRSIDNVTTSALGGAALAVVVLLAFLRNLRATAVVATSIPISVLATFVLMDAFGISMNTISFGGLALGIGMLVDNAIVLLENIFRRREEGLPAHDAATRGSEEVASAITASTTTTVAVFAPVLFVAGFAGIFFREMAIVVSFSLLCSLVVALTLVPSLAGQLLRGDIRPPTTGVSGRLYSWSERAFLALEARYRGVLVPVLRHPWRTLGAGVALFGGALLLGSLVSFELMPEADEGELDVNIELPVGTPVETTMQVVQQVETRALAALQPGEVDNVLTFAGPENWWRPAGGNEGSMELILTPSSSGRRHIDAIAEDVTRALSDLPGVRLRVRKSSGNFLGRLMRGGGDDRLSVVVRGHDLETSDRLGREVERIARDLDGVTFARIDREPPKLERVVRIDRDRISELGLRGADVAEAVETYLLGRVATRFRDDGGEYDVRVRLQEDERTHLAQLRTLPVVTPDGRTVPLSQVARIEEHESPSSISRENQERVLNVNVGIAGRPLGDVVADLREGLGSVAVPEGFQVEIAGEHEQQQETFAGLGVGLLLAIFLVYSVMAVQFESIRDPLVVMGAVPFAFIGVVLSLVLTNTTFSMYAFLGAIVLVGIVVNNAIVLVDTANQLRRDHGASLGHAIVEASTRRLRPILMTTLTTSLAMVPLALGIGEGSELQAPLARVVIGGLIVSTSVTLLVVPTLYQLAWRRSERLQANAEPASAAS